MVNISKTKRNFIALNTLFAILSGAAGAVILHIALPGHYFGGYPFIPVYFYIFGVFSIYMFDACRRHAPQKLSLLYLAMKMIKMILSLILLLIYCLAVREEAKAFLLTFISFYLLYLIYETWFFFSFEVNLKRKKKNKNKNETVAYHSSSDISALPDVGSRSAGLRADTGRCDSAGAEREYGRCEGDRVRAYRRLIRMAYYDVG